MVYITSDMDTVEPDQIIVVTENPLSLLLKFPDSGGVTPCRYESVEEFAKIIAETRKRYPGQKFQFIPFSYGEGPDPDVIGLTSILAVAD